MKIDSSKANVKRISMNFDIAYHAIKLKNTGYFGLKRSFKPCLFQLPPQEELRDSHCYEILVTCVVVVSPRCALCELLTSCPCPVLLCRLLLSFPPFCSQHSMPQATTSKTGAPVGGLIIITGDLHHLQEFCSHDKSKNNSF